MKKTLSAVLALAMSSSVAAADYRGDITVAYTDLDDGDKGKLIAGRYYFSDVQTDSRPLAEAAYLQRSNNITLVHARSEYRGFADSQDTWGMVELYIPQAMLYLAPFYIHRSYDFTYGGSDSSNDWGAYLGLTPIHGMRISTTWVEDIDYELNVHMKYVVDVSEANAINLELTYEEASESVFADTVSAAMDFYFDRTFSIGAEVEDEEDTSFGIRTTKFFTERFSTSAEYTKHDEYNTWLISAALRF